MQPHHIELSIVVPVWNEADGIDIFLDTLTPILNSITKEWECIFAVDPCTDDTEEKLIEASRNDSRIKMLRFSRRFGQPAATWAGLAFSKGDAVIPIDCDMQDPPSLIPEMVRLWKEGNMVVLPQRRSREGENCIKKTIAYVGYWFINKTATVSIPRNTGDFRLMDRRVVNELMKLKECHGFLRGLTALVGFKTVLLPFDRLARAKGKGKYNAFTGSILIGFNGIVSFSGSLLRMMGVGGLALAGLSVLAALLIPLAKLLGVWDFATGLVTLGVLLLFLTGCQLIGLGILGAYIGRIYDVVKERPKFIVEYSIGFEEEPDNRH